MKNAVYVSDQAQSYMKFYLQDKVTTLLGKVAIELDVHLRFVVNLKKIEDDTQLLAGSIFCSVKKISQKAVNVMILQKSTEN